MNQYNGIDHVRAAFKRTFTDRVPFYAISGTYNARQYGYSIKDFLISPEVFAKCQLQFFETYNPDILVMMADLLMEAEAAGNLLEFSDVTICQVKKYALEDKTKLSSLRVPEPQSTARLPYYIEACRIAAGEVKTSAVSSIICGPWAIAVSLRGAQRILYDTLDDPEFVQDLMVFTTEIVKKFSLALKSVGVSVSLSEAPASCSLISPEIYQKFIKPYHAQLVDYYKQNKIGSSLHVCGYIDPIMEDVLDCSFGSISIDAPTSLKRMVELNQKRAVIIGNIATDLFARGTFQQIEEAIKQCIDIAADGSAYVLATGCEIPTNSDPAKVRHFVEAAERLGKYNR
ncbi:MAG: uroporphyrinogen decarboxylase family protein [Candidatus Tectomicrobia bacterium]|uniref:Uroporphyrinogen decarboxylase family protein n=1 Tax=Tectimicrobiota bacterium TaxID=2528274 RepID=A0A933GLD9_UNCTE|nr:uroporphyrinogen decarboxylase family protein [Candidatus Tectomicrobia bacterium]